MKSSMKREFPLFIIDKRLKVEYPYHHIVVMDSVPFVIRVKLLDWEDKYTPNGAHCYYVSPSLFLARKQLLFEAISDHNNTVKTKRLIKRAAEKYLKELEYPQCDNASSVDLDIQILQQKSMIEDMKEVLHSGICQDANEEKIVKFKISISENILKSLYLLKEFARRNK